MNQAIACVGPLILLAAAWACGAPLAPDAAPEPPTAIIEVPRLTERGRLDAEWLCFVADDKYLVARYSWPECGGLMVAWDTATLKASGQWKVGPRPASSPLGPLCAFDPDKKCLIYLDEGLPRCRSIEGWKQVELAGWRDAPRELRSLTRRAIWFAESTRGIYVASDPASLLLRRWTPRDTPPALVLEKHFGTVHCVGLDQACATLAVAHQVDKDTHQLTVIDVQQKEALSSTQLRVSARCMSLSPDGKSVAVGFADGTLAMYECATGKRALSIPTGANRAIWAVAWRGPLVAFATNDRPPEMNVRVFDIEQKKYILTDAAGGVAPPEAIALSNDGKRLATLGADGVIHLWRLDKKGRTDK